MAHINVWLNAIIVLDANVLLNIFRFAPHKSRELLKTLEGLSIQIWIPRQFWYEYKSILPTISTEIKQEYLENKDGFQHLHNKSLKKIEHITARTRYEFNPQISSLLDQANALFVEEVTTFRSEHSTWLRGSNIEFQVEQHFASKVGDPLPDSLRADIPLIWQYRLDQNIPPGLKDHEKPEPNRYGDLIGWLQIIRHAVGRGRPVIMVTDDVKADDWFVLRNGVPSGPPPELARELYDEAGVELYMYTSEQFMRHANIYLKWKHSLSAASELSRWHRTWLVPNLGNVARAASMVTPIRSVLDSFATTGATQRMFADMSANVAVFQSSISAAGQIGMQVEESIAAIVSQYNAALNMGLAKPILSDLVKTITPSVNISDSILPQLGQEQQRTIEMMLKPNLEIQRTIDAITKSTLHTQQLGVGTIIKQFQADQRRIREDITKGFFP